MFAEAVNPTLAESGVAHLLVEDLALPELSADARHHLGTVRRLRDGDAITLGDGQGRWRVAVLRQANKSSGRAGLEIELASEVFEEARQQPELVIGYCLPSLDRAGWAIQKMTELGVDSVFLLHSAFSSARRSGLEDGGHDYAKLQRVAGEALMQSRSPFLTRLSPIRSLESFVELYPQCGVCTAYGNDGLDPSFPVVVGPEGGFSASELGLFTRRIGLGKNVLRSETAAVVVAGVLSMERSGLL
ncbi:MAG: 16S rRNA (uracil(1498)-N(3))-methyltransferase [Acidimicrobiaceae bacterium]|nr:16S rRNA (uracil(1498)-N(3))-methyltransferase [Acidimicrobiaceae bacterium]